MDGRRLNGIKTIAKKLGAIKSKLHPEKDAKEISALARAEIALMDVVDEQQEQQEQQAA